MVALWVVSGCAAVQFNLGPTPPVPEAPPRPSEPDATAVPTAFAADDRVDPVGATRLGLARQALGVGPADGLPAAPTLTRELVRALVAGGFRKVQDLSDSGRVFAFHARISQGSETRLVGRMPTMLELAPVSRAQVVVLPEIRAVWTEPRELPVHFTYRADVLTSYEQDRTLYEVQRTAILGELSRIDAAYTSEFEAAEKVYLESRPWWQKTRDAVDRPAEFTRLDRFHDEVEATRDALGRSPLRSAEELDAAARQRNDTSRVDVHVLETQTTLVDAASGSVLVVLDVRVEALTADDLAPRMAAVLADALEAL